MLGRIVKDWSKVNLRDPKDARKVMGAMQHFMLQPAKNPELRGAMQHLAIKGDLPAEILSIIEKYHAVPDYDTGYEQIFDIRDFTGTRESGFEILDVSSGLTFEEVKTGEKAKVYKFAGTKAQVTFARYAAALGWDRTMIDDGKYWLLEDNAIEFRAQAYSTKAQAHYDLIAALPSAQNLAWQAPTPAALAATDARYTASKDANTINAACLKILKDLKDLGMAVNANSPFVVLAPIDLRPRIKAALAYADLTLGGARVTDFNIQPLYTMMLASTTSYYVILPKKKLKGGNRQDLTLLFDDDILAYTTVEAGWMRFGAAIGEVKQIVRCATS